VFDTALGPEFAGAAGGGGGGGGAGEATAGEAGPGGGGTCAAAWVLNTKANTLGTLLEITRGCFFMDVCVRKPIVGSLVSCRRDFYHPIVSCETAECTVLLVEQGPVGVSPSEQYLARSVCSR
jgi:hypothetical protein